MARAERQLPVCVVDSKGSPIPSATVTFGDPFDSPPSSKDKEEGTPSTREGDTFFVHTFGDGDAVWVRAEAKGYAGRRHRYTNFAPSQIVIEMPPTETLTGRLLNEDRSPARNATVILQISSDIDSTGFNIRIGSSDERGTHVTTDNEGRFELKNAPKTAISADVSAMSVGRFTKSNSPDGGATLKQLRDGTYELKFEQPPPAIVTVVDEKDSPITGASVEFYHDLHETILTKTTDATGKCQVPRLPATCCLVVTAPGFGRQAVSDSSTSYHIILHPETALRLKLQNEAGNLITHAFVLAGTLRPDGLWDIQGRAPGEQIYVAASGYQARWFPLTGGEASLTLLPPPPTRAPLTILGQVLDDTTGRPINRARITPLLANDENAPTAKPGLPPTFAIADRFTLQYYNPWHDLKAVAVSASADGYTSTTTDKLFLTSFADDNTLALTIRLKKP